MEAKTGIYDFVYIEQDIIYAYLARNFLVDITKTLEGQSEAEGAGLRRGQLHHLHQLLQGRPRTATSSACRWRPSSRSISTARTSSTIPKVKDAFKAKYGQRPGAGQDPRGIHRDRRVLHRMGQGQRPGAVGHHGPGAYRPPGVLVRVLRERRADFRRLQLGHRRRQQLRRARVANGGAMNSDKAKAALKYWLHLRKIAPPESTAEHLGRGRGDLRRRPRRPGPGLRRERRLDRHRRREVQGRRQGRRRAAAARAGRDGRCRGRQGLYRLL